MSVIIPFPHRALATPSPKASAPNAPCIICGSNVDWDLFKECCGCAAVMHEVCYYGRVASLEEWLTFLRIADSNEDPIWPDAVCPACRAAKGGA
jgi:hypothetical protein